MAAVPRGLLIGAFSLPALLLSCGGGAPYKPPVYTISVAPQPASVAAGSTVTFTATTNAPNVSWGLVGTGSSGDFNPPPNFAGSPQLATGTTYTYTAPSTPPIYFGVIPAPGTVTIRALAGTTSVDTTITITAPSITTGFFTPPSTSIALGSTVGISAYAVGSTNNALILQVNGITGGSASVGTIAPVPQGAYLGEYQYTAPATMPMTGNTVTITVISQADPTQSSNLALTLH